MVETASGPDNVSDYEPVCGDRTGGDRMQAVSMWRRDDGQTMSEYAIVLAVITPAIVAALALLSDAFVERLETVAGFFT
jgi:Flp pilus assembly pilin Flp